VLDHLLLEGRIGLDQPLRSLLHPPLQLLLRPFQGILSQLSLRNVAYESLQGEKLPMLIEYALPLLPDPLGAGGCPYAIGEAEGPPLLQCRLDLIPDIILISRMYQICKGEALIVQKVLGLPAGQLQTSVTDKLHSPLLVVLAAIGHAGKVAHQRGKSPLALLESHLSAPALQYLPHSAHEQGELAHIGLAVLFVFVSQSRHDDDFALVHDGHIHMADDIDMSRRSPPSLGT